jgi:hypothetical protein
MEERAMVEMRYELHESVTVEQLRDAIHNIWEKIQTDSSLREQIKKDGIDLNELNPIDLDKAITIEREGMGIDPVTAAVIVAFAPVAATVLKDLWTNVFLRIIKQKMGIDVINPKQE